MEHKKKKILFVCHTMRGGGVEHVLLNIMNLLLKLNYDITLLLVRKEGNFLHFIPKEITVKYLAKGNEFYPENYILKNLNKVIRKLKFKVYNLYPSLIRTLVVKDTYDIEVVFFGDLMLLWQKILKKETKNIGWIHGMLIGEKGEGDKTIVEASYKFDKVICVSHVVRDSIIKFFPQFKNNSEVIYNPINKNEIVKKALEKINWKYKYPTFISIGRLTRLKGYFQMMQIHKRLIDEGFSHEIVIVGTGEDYEEMLIEIKKMEIQDTYHLTGHQQNPYPYLKNGDYFFLFSSTEGYPLAVQEALLFNKPMIVTQVGGIPEIVENEKTAVVIKQDNEEMYQAMKKFLTTPSFTEKLTENCKTVSEKYEEAQIYNRIVEVLK